MIRSGTEGQHHSPSGRPRSNDTFLTSYDACIEYLVETAYGPSHEPQLLVAAADSLSVIIVSNRSEVLAARRWSVRT